MKGEKKTNEAAVEQRARREVNKAVDELMGKADPASDELDAATDKKIE